VLQTKREGQNGTWINNDLIESFNVLHGMGIAHSVESYQDDNLVGGLYGLAIGKVVLRRIDVCSC